MSRLLIKNRAPGAGGLVHQVTPQSAGWSHVGCDIYRLAPGQSLAAATGEREVCLVLLAGKAAVLSGSDRFDPIGERASPFKGKPFGVYIPWHRDYEVRALTELELAVCSAPGGGEFPVRLITPDDVQQITRGQGTNTRYVQDILPESVPAHRLLVVEVITPSGCWSSYPSHKHDQDALPDESLLEETYYHRFAPPQGFGFQRVYTDDRALDEAMCIEDGDMVLVPKGYHPCATAHGYDLYYLNVMAGPKRVWRFATEPCHQWLLES